MPEVVVIVLSFNSLSKLGSVFRELSNRSLTQEGEFRVVFVDNGSKDETPRMFK